jgi:hypothetical protein
VTALETFMVQENGLAGYPGNGPNFTIVTLNKKEPIANVELYHCKLERGETPPYLLAKRYAFAMAAAPSMLHELKNLCNVFGQGLDPVENECAYRAIFRAKEVITEAEEMGRIQPANDAGAE